MANKRRRTKKKEGLVATLRDPKKITIAYIIAGLALVFGGSLGFGGSQCQGPPVLNPYNQSDPSDVLARIEDREITWYEYMQELRNEEARIQAEARVMSPEYIADYRYRVLRRMIEMEYFDIRAIELGITVDEAKVDERIDEYKHQLIPERTSDEDRSLLQRALETLGTVKEEQAFQTRLQQTNPNMTVSRLKTLIRHEIKAQNYIATLQSGVQSEIMGELTEEANSIRQEIIDGLSFASAATTYSDHADSKQGGGLIPAVRHNDENLPVVIIENAFSLPVGELSQPLPSLADPPEGGVWLMMVESRKEATGQEWENARGPLHSQLLEEKRQKVQEGELEVPENEELTVSEEELKAAYEEATIRVIKLEAEDPMGRISEMVKEDLNTMDLEINDLELLATHQMFNKDWYNASLSLYEAFKNNSERNPIENGMDIQYAIDSEEARLRYLIANLWATRAFSLEGEWMQGIYNIYLENPDAFAGGFPDTPSSITEAQQGYFVLSLANLNRSLEIEDIQPFAHKQRAYIDVAREQVSPRLVGDIRSLFDYSSDDFNLVSEAAQLVNRAVKLDDDALTAAGNVRPETYVSAILPEDQLGLTLGSLDAPFIAAIASGVEESAPVSDPAAGEPAAVEEAELPELTETLDSTAVEGEGSVEPFNIESVIPEGTEEEITIEPGVPTVVKADPSGPLTAEERQILEDLQAEVQVKYDILNAERQALEEQRQAAQQAQIEALPVNEPEEPEAPSDDAVDLIEETE